MAFPYIICNVCTRPVVQQQMGSVLVAASTCLKQGRHAILQGAVGQACSQAAARLFQDTNAVATREAT
jgi:hypothetical protein